MLGLDRQIQAKVRDLEIPSEQFWATENSESWIVLATIVTWPRFPETVVPDFLQGMRELGSDDDD